MTIPAPQLPYPKAGDRPDHDDIAQLSNAVAALVPALNSLVDPEGPVPGRGLRAVDTFLAIVRAAGPAGETAPPGTYYLDRAVPPPSQNPRGLLAPAVDNVAGIKGTYLATNLGELTGDSPPQAAAGARSVSAGQVVKVTRWVSRTNFQGTTVTGGDSLFTFNHAVLASGGELISLTGPAGPGAYFAAVLAPPEDYDVSTPVAVGKMGSIRQACIAINLKEQGNPGNILNTSGARQQVFVGFYWFSRPDGTTFYTFDGFQVRVCQV